MKLLTTKPCANQSIRRNSWSPRFFCQSKLEKKTKLKYYYAHLRRNLWSHPPRFDLTIEIRGINKNRGLVRAPARLTAAKRVFDLNPSVDGLFLLFDREHALVVLEITFMIRMDGKHFVKFHSK